MSKLFIRFSIILFWIALIFAALYWPKWKIFKYDANSITVFAWGDILEPSVIAKFEKETGIKVYLNYYSSNEELLVKLKATRGEGYDLIIPSDYAVRLLAQEGLLQEIDKAKLDFFQNINPLLLGHSFDPENRYSIPFEWEIFGLGIDKDYFKNHSFDPSWKLLFDHSLIHYKVTMINDPIEALLFASYYLYGPLDNLNKEQAINVKKLLLQQKKWVEAYADFRADYFLATKNCPVVLASSSYIWRSKRMFNFIEFAIPKEGTFITIENLSIPKSTDKQALIYKFINHLFKPESIKTHFDAFGFFPSTTHNLSILSLSQDEKDLILSSSEAFKKYHFIKALLPQKQIQNIWVEVKSEGE
jgi:spermidine/putrescine transport system substrate-binding protein